VLQFTSYSFTIHKILIFQALLAQPQSKCLLLFLVFSVEKIAVARVAGIDFDPLQEAGHPRVDARISGTAAALAPRHLIYVTNRPQK
jgi:hypothetical protein